MKKKSLAVRGPYDPKPTNNLIAMKEAAVKAIENIRLDVAYADSDLMSNWVVAAVREGIAGCNFEAAWARKSKHDVILASVALVRAEQATHRLRTRILKQNHQEG